MRPLSNSIKGRGVVFLVVVVCLFSSAAAGQPWLGSGTAEDPYQIWTAADMQAIGGNSAYWGAKFKLMADIDLSAYTGTSFNIIGYYGSQYDQKPFYGVFDGNGHTISNFTYSSTGTDYIGLFRLGGSPGKIKDLGLINPNVDAGNGDRVGGLVGHIGKGPSISNCYVEGGNVSGTTNVGGLAGIIAGWVTISNCYSTASVSGTTNVGGLVGHNAYRGTIINCYSEGSVSGDANVGGLVGRNGEAVIKCYSTGSVSGTTKVGGLVGWGVPVCASFWDTQTSGQSTSGGGKGKTTAEMQTADTFFGWGGCGSEGVWVLDEGNDYPRLWWEDKAGQPLPTENLSDFVAGAGTEQDPYLIETGEQMNLVGLFWCEWDKHFKLMADIDLSAYTGTSFNIIKGFTGVFDGNGHTISNFSYDSNNTDNIGIFGYNVGKIRDLGLINPNVDAGTGYYVGSLVGTSGGVTGCYTEGGSVSGNDYVGGLVGGTHKPGVWGGPLTNCSSNTSVSGHWYVGGLVGWNFGQITNCSSNASVLGDKYVGGLVGTTISPITSCYSTASVSGIGEVGGLVGSNGTVDSGHPDTTNCYSTASVTGYWYVGGLVGHLWNGPISNCYSAGSVEGMGGVGGLVGYKEAGGLVTYSFWDTETSGQTTSGGGFGLTTELMQTAFIFTSAGWDFVGETINGTEDIWDICDGTNYPKLAWQVPVLGDFGCPDGVDESDLGVLCGEWLFELIPADVWPNGGDGIVNFLDWAIFADGWQTTHDIFDLAEFADKWLKTGSNDLIADIAPAPGGDGIVNMLDFAALAENWMEGM